MSFANPQTVAGLTPDLGIRIASTTQQQLVSGMSVAFLGDTNGDSIADFGVGDAYGDIGAQADAGLAQEFFGKFAFTSNLLVGTATADRTRVVGDNLFGLLGTSISGVGDVNGDGRADWLVGVQSMQVGTTIGAGGAVLVYGAAPGAGGTVPDLSTASLGARAVRLNGLEGGSLAGGSVSGAGDVNGDGHADFLVGALGADVAAGVNAGSAMLVYGGPSLAGTLNLGALGSAGVRVNGLAAGDNLGYAVAGVGDLNGDGFADVAFGAPGADPGGRTGAGSVYVVFGSATGIAGVDIANPGARGFRVDGAAGPTPATPIGDQLGAAVSAAGDVNGDGFMDLLIAAPNASPLGRDQAGAAYLVFGKAGGWGNLDLSTVSFDAGFNGQVLRIAGAAGSDALGTAVSGWGDVNGDGLSDILLGAPGANSGAGSAFLLLGRTGGWDNIDLASAADVTRFDGAAGSRFGTSVALNGDANGDGFADVLVGAPPTSSGTANRASQAYLFFSQSPDGEPDGGEAIFDGTTLRDSLTGGAGADILSGGGNNDFLLGRAGSDQLLGGAGDDTLNGGTGQNLLDGGDGKDMADYGWVTGAMTISLGAGTAVGGGVSDTIRRVEVAQAGSASDRIGGDANANTLLGGDGNDDIFGGAGDDALLGQAGDDVMYGEAGNDTMTGGAGSDKYAVADAGDVVVEGAADAGQDIAFVSANGWTIAANLEVTYMVGNGTFLIGSGAADFIGGNVALGSTINAGGGDDQIFGRAFNDTLRGEAGNDILRGDAGDDVLVGGAGNDQLVGGAGADRFVFDTAAFGTDDLFDFSRAEGDKLDFRGTGLVLDSSLVLQDLGGNSIVYTFQNGEFHTVRVYGVSATTGNALTASDFLF